jgi:hypothetical protein
MIAIKNTISGRIVAVANKMNEAIDWLTNNPGMIPTHGIFPDAEASAEETKRVNINFNIGGAHE